MFRLFVFATVGLWGIGAVSSEPNSSTAQVAPAIPVANVCGGPAIEVNANYDKFKDQTVVEVGPLKIPKQAMSLRIAYLVHGNATTAPKALMFHFVSDTEHWRFLDSSRRLILLVDGVKIDLGTAEHHGDVLDSGGVLEQMIYEVPVASFKKFVDAQTIEAQLSTAEFQFSPAHRLALKMIAAAAWPKEFIDPVKDILAQPRPKLSIKYRSVDAQLATQYGIPSGRVGAVVVGVEEGGWGAECVGFKVGHLITDVDGVGVSSAEEFKRVLAETAKQEFSVTVWKERRFPYGNQPPKFDDTRLSVNYRGALLENYFNQQGAQTKAIAPQN